VKGNFISILSLLALMPISLPALHPGHSAAPLSGIRWINGNPLDTARQKEANLPELRAVVFLHCRAVAADDTARMLEKLQRDCGGKLKIAIITPDPEADAEAFAARHSSSPAAVGVDHARNITPVYMEGSLLYPQAFLIDRSGKIMWRGEAIDLGEAVKEALNGAVSISREAKISRLMEELQILMRDNRDNYQGRVVQQIFDLDPDNPAALRMRLFTLENTGRSREAKKLIDERINTVPGSARLYFTALDFAARHGAESTDLRRLLTRFNQNITDADTRISMAWLLLERFPMDAAMLKEAAQIINQVKSNSPAYFATRSMLYFRTGRIAGALADQEQAVKLLRQSGDKASADRAEAMAEYYRTAMKVAKSLP